MKHIMIAMALAMTMGSTAMAQDANRPLGRGPQQMDKNEMAKTRTDDMSKRYGLSEEQAGKLLELNLLYADSMRSPMMGRQRPEGQQRLQGEGRPERPEGRPGNGERGQVRERMQKVMEGYDARLKDILTEEQFKAYKEDASRRFNRGGRGGDRQRPPRRDNNMQ